MYEYIKGYKVGLEEHMLSASEIATMYGIYTENGQPHSLMISVMLREYVTSNNLNIAEYYYPHSKGCMRVYPEVVWKPALVEFYYRNNLEFDNSLEKRVYDIKSEKKKFQYIHKSITNKRVINIAERRKK